MSTARPAPRPTATAARPTRATTAFDPPAPTSYKTFTQSEKGAEVFATTVRNGATQTVYRRPSSYNQSQTLSKRGTIILAVVLGIALVIGLLVFGCHLHRRRKIRATKTSDDEAVMETYEVKGSPVVNEGRQEGSGYEVGYAAGLPVGKEEVGSARAENGVDEKEQRVGTVEKGTS